MESQKPGVLKQQIYSDTELLLILMQNKHSSVISCFAVKFLLIFLSQLLAQFPRMTRTE